VCCTPGSAALSNEHHAQDDDGFVLFESAAIARYIAAKADSPLLPRGDLHGVALFEQAMSVEKSQFETAIQPFTAERVAKPLFTDVPPDEERVAVLVKTLETKLAAYEMILAKQRYLAGGSLTLADLLHLPLGTYVGPQGFSWFDDNGAYPNVARCVLFLLRSAVLLILRRWWAEISSLPTWKEVQRIVHELTPLYEASLKPYLPK
jgi:glutathione S-transferase